MSLLKDIPDRLPREMALHLGCRCHGHKQELNKFLVGMPDKSFGDISHDRDSSSLNLSAKTTVFLPSLALAYGFVYQPRQLSSFVPTIEILKTADFHRTRRLGLPGLLLILSPHQIDKTDLIDQIDHLETAPPFHLQMQIADTAQPVARKRQALSWQTESQHFFPWHSRLDQLFFAQCRMIEIRDQDPIELPSTHPLRGRNRTRKERLARVSIDKSHTVDIHLSKRQISQFG